MGSHKKRSAPGRGLWALYLSDGLTALLLTLGGAFAFFSVCGVDWPIWLPAAVGAMALAGALLWSLPRGGCAAAGGVLVLGALIVWRRWPLLSPAFAALGQAVAEDLGTLAFFAREAGDPAMAVPWPGTAEPLLWLAALYALVMGWAAVRQRWWYLALTLAALPSAPAIAAGTLPAWPALLAALAGSLALLLSDLLTRDDPAALGRGQLVSVAAAAALLAALSAALPQEGYARPQWADRAHDWVITLGERAAEAVLSIELPESGGGEGGGTGGALTLDDGGAEDLTEAGPRRFSNRPVLYLEGEGQGRLYLRGASLATYTGESWEAVSPTLYEAVLERMVERVRESDQDTYWETSGQEGETSFYVTTNGTPDQAAVSPLMWPAQTLSGESRSLLVRPAASGVLAYAPYQMLPPLSNGLSMYQDSAVLAEDGLETYQIIYRDGDLTAADLDLAGPAGSMEGIYRSFVRAQYTDVPDRAAAALTPLLREMETAEILPAEDVPEAYRPAVETARRAAAVLASRAAYDINTPAIEEGEDFVESFLARGQGYCVHFATAGTLLTRMAGVPARYVSGFAAYLDGTGRATVRDSAAHAWVEIYLEGFGWYPVEMTPAYLDAGGAADETEPLPDPAEPVAPVEPEPPEETPQPPETPETAGGAAETAPEWKLDLRWLGYAALAALLGAALALPRYLGRAYRRRQAALPETGRSVVAAYRRCRRLARWGGAPPPELEALAKKAVFSQHRLTEEERASAWAMAREAEDKAVGAMSPVKRFFFRWLGLLM